MKDTIEIRVHLKKKRAAVFALTVLTFVDHLTLLSDIPFFWSILPSFFCPALINSCTVRVCCHWVPCMYSSEVILRPQ